MSKLSVHSSPSYKLWYVVLDNPYFRDARTRKQAWLHASARLQKLADQAKAKYEGMK